MKRLVVLIAIFVLLLSGETLGISLDFNQLSWRADNGGYTAVNSEYGQANILFEAGDHTLFANKGTGFEGYLNLVTTVPGGSEASWSVRNIPMYFDSYDAFTGRLADTFWFDLGTTRSMTSVTSLEYFLTISGTPLTNSPTGTMVSSIVTSQNVLFGGEIGTAEGIGFKGGSGQSPPPIINHVLNVFGAGVGSSGKIKIKTKDVEDVAELHNGCAPGAKTRSLKYLEISNKGLHIKENTSDLYQKMYSYMATDKDGTIINPNFKIAVDEYSQELAGDGTNGPIKTEIGVKDLDRVLKALLNGDDVEMGVFWGYNLAGESLGGHCVFVTQVDVYEDSDGKMTGYKVTYVDDPDQLSGTSGDKTNNKQRHLIFDKDGKLSGPGVGRDATLNDFRIETVVPEPSTCLLFGIGLAGVWFCGRRKQKGIIPRV